MGSNGKKGSNNRQYQTDNDTPCQFPRRNKSSDNRWKSFQILNSFPFRRGNEGHLYYRPQNIKSLSLKPEFVKSIGQNRIIESARLNGFVRLRFQGIGWPPIPVEIGGTKFIRPS